MQRSALYINLQIYVGQIIKHKKVSHVKINSHTTVLFLKIISVYLLKDKMLRWHKYHLYFLIYLLFMFTCLLKDLTSGTKH